MFAWLLKIFTSQTIGKITDYLTARSSDLATTHGHDTKAATDIVVAQMQAEIEARKAQVAFTSRHDTLVTWIASAFILHVWMIVLDRCFHLGWNVPALPKPLDEWEGTIILSFFIVTPAATLAKAVIAKVWK